MPNTWAGLVLAAGEGVRMNSQIPKPLHEIAEVPMLSYTVRSLERAGLARIVVVISESMAGSWLPRLKRIAPESIFKVQNSGKGTGAAPLFAKDALADAKNIVLRYSDVPFVSADTLEGMMRLHESSGALMTALTGKPRDIFGLGRVLRDEAGHPLKIVEAADLDDSTRGIEEANTGGYCFDTEWCFKSLENLKPVNGEIRLTDLLELASAQGKARSFSVTEAVEQVSVNSRMQLAQAERVFRSFQCERLMRSGVTVTDPQTTYVSSTAKVGRDTVILPGTHLMGDIEVGEDCVIGPNAVIKDSVILDKVRIEMANLEGCRINSRASVGPYCRVRDGSVIGSGASIGNCAEIKNSDIGKDVRIGHFSYVGDTSIGDKTNIGAGAVTCNFDGVKKHRTLIGKGVFVGSGVMMVAPLHIGENSMIGAGAVVTHDVERGSTVAGVPARPMSMKGTTVDRSTL